MQIIYIYIPGFSNWSSPELLIWKQNVAEYSVFCYGLCLYEVVVLVDSSDSVERGPGSFVRSSEHGIQTLVSTEQGFSIHNT